MVRTSLAIEREVDDTRNKRKENHSSSNSGKKQKTSIPRGFQRSAAVIKVKAKSGLLPGQDR